MPHTNQDVASSSSSSGHSQRKDSRQRTATAGSSSALASDAVPRSLRISDQQLVQTAQHAASTIDWDTLCDSSARWSAKKSAADNESFYVTERQEDAVHHIMARGSVTCSVAEMKHALWTTNSERYRAAMHELHDTNFLGGAVEYRLDTSAVATAATAASGSAPATSSDYELCVKTAMFAKPHVFARNEHWCFIDHLQLQRDRSAFTITMHSLRADNVLLAAPAAAQSKNQLEEMTAGYAVAANPRGRSVSLAFYARFLDTTTSSSNNGDGSAALRASKSTTKARLLKIAKATSSLAAIVQRRRLGAQVFANPMVLPMMPNNTHCKCCTLALTLFVAKRRCHLCGYRVCTKCLSKHELERAVRSSSRMGRKSRRSSSSLEPVCVCAECLRRVNAADYDDLPSGLASPPAIQPNRDGKDARVAGNALVEFLRRSYENATDAPRKKALVQVARNLLENEGSGPPSSRSASARSRSGTTGSQVYSVASDESKCSGDVTDGSDKDRDDLACFESLERQGCVREIALEDCVVAHAESRTYPIEYRESNFSADDVDSAATDDADSKDVDDSDTTVTHYPVPVTEQSRIAFVAKQQFTSMTDVPELEIICGIASEAMDCAAGLVTIIADDKIHIIASNDAGYQNLVVPRAESICSHMVMSDKPLLLPHTAADIRFNQMPPVRHAGVRFYCGFPLIGPDNAVYGSVCCVDSKSHDVTQSQYAVMTKLAETAARVMAMRAPKA